MEEKTESVLLNWAVKWAKTSRRIAIIGWWAVLLNLILFIIFGVLVESLHMPRPSTFERVFGTTLAILFWGTTLCFILSFISGVISLFAPLFTIVRFKDIEKTAVRGISLSLLYFFFFSLLMGPVILRRIRHSKIHCRRNLDIISSKVIDNPESFANNWCDAIKDGTTINSDSLKCNYDKIGPCSYAMNENIPADADELPDDLVLLFESDSGWNQIGGADDVVTDRHGEKNPGANIAFADGHVEFVKPEDIPTLRWTIEQQPEAPAQGSE